MTTDLIRQSLVAVKVLLVMTLVLGVAYPAAVWGVGQTAFHDRANGQIVRQDGKDRGSALIGQHFEVADDPWFHGRPSASDYDGLVSGASNLGPSSPELLELIQDRQAQIAAVEGVPVSAIPADAVTASASGLDPFISPAYAALQVDRVATQRGLAVEAVRRLVQENAAGRQLGFIGEPKVNVLRLNLALERR